MSKQDTYRTESESSRKRIEELENELYKANCSQSRREWLAKHVLCAEFAIAAILFCGVVGLLSTLVISQMRKPADLPRVERELESSDRCIDTCGGNVQRWAFHPNRNASECQCHRVCQ